MNQSSPTNAGPSVNFALLAFWVLALAALTFFLLGYQATRPGWRAAGEAIRIGAGGDHHFRIPGRVADQETWFLVDTGATITALPDRLLPAPIDCRRETFSTANGSVSACLTRVQALHVGPYRIAEVPVAILAQLDQPLLGAEVLQRFHSETAQGVLTLRPLPGRGVFTDQTLERRSWTWHYGAGLLLALAAVTAFRRWRRR